MAKMPKAPHIPSFTRVIKAFEKAQEIVEVGVAEFAEEEKDAFKARIRTQDFSSFDAAKLNPAYKARKVKQGFNLLQDEVMVRIFFPTWCTELIEFGY